MKPEYEFTLFPFFLLFGLQLLKLVREEREKKIK